MAAEPVEAVARGRRWLVGVGLLALGCEQTVPLLTIDGVVEVPAAVHQRFTPEAPGQLIVEAEVTGTPPFSFRAGVLCGDAGVEPISLPVTYTTTGCSATTPARLRAWVANRGNAAFDFCGLTDAGVGPWPLDVGPGSALAIGRQTVEPIRAAQPLNACTSAHFGLSVTLSED